MCRRPVAIASAQIRLYDHIWSLLSDLITHDPAILTFDSARIIWVMVLSSSGILDQDKQLLMIFACSGSANWKISRWLYVIKM